MSNTESPTADTPEGNDPENGLVTNDDPLAQRIERYRNDISASNFETWHSDHEKRRNLEEGYGQSRNNPESSSSDNSHSPSSLLQCHRKIYYRSKSAPEEYPKPYGIFLIGHLFEEAVIEPWLQENVIKHDEFIGNAGHVNFIEDEGDQEIRFAGSHDPKIADVRGQTLAVTEVKSTGSDPHFLQKPKRHHKAQAHAYMKGLYEKEDALTDYPPAFIIYVQKETLDIFPFFIEFDEDFWEEVVVDWARQNAGYRMAGILPDAKPILGQNENNTKATTFECDYCDYRNRCGNYNHRGDKHRYDDTVADHMQGAYADHGEKGFLPLKVYPEESAVEHVLAHKDVKLTPTLAAKYPELVKNPSARLKSKIQERNREHIMKRKYGAVPKREVHDWVCSECDTTYDFDEFDWWDGDVNDTPYCDHCQDETGNYFPLRGPLPDEAEYNN